LHYVQNQDKVFPLEIKQEIQRYKEECNMVVEYIEENKDYTVQGNCNAELSTFIKGLYDWCKNRCITKPSAKKIAEMLTHVNCEVNSINNQIAGLQYRPFMIENTGPLL
jgi:hypothetical protein